jgi:ribose transport system permease protein
MHEQSRQGAQTTSDESGRGDVMSEAEVSTSRMGRDRMKSLARNLSFSNIGAIYTWVLIIVVFTIWVPHLFPTRLTIEAIADNFSISALAALAILVPIASGTFDASVGGTISLSAVFCGWLMIHTGLPIWIVVILTLVAGGCVGLFNAFAVVVLRIPALIATLATWLIADSLSVGISGNQTISSPRLSGDFSKIAQQQVGGFNLPVFYAIAITIVLGVVLTQTAVGRYIYAVGFDPQVSRLAGIRVQGIQTGSLVCAGVIGAFAGVVLTSRVASATPSGGDAYLLPAFAAAFLGATQFRSKRFNATGTTIAVFMLGTGQYGLLLAGAPQWMPNVFQGFALVAAIGLTQLHDPNRIRRRRGARQRPDASPEPEAKASPVDGRSIDTAVPS